MRWKRFVKLAMDHPYFDDPKHTLSEAQAEALLTSSGSMEFDAFMESVKRRMDEIDRGIREPVDTPAILPDADSVHPARYSACVRDGLLRNIALAGIAIILLTGFLAFTNPGRAIAQAIYRAIVSVVDGKLSGRQTVPDNEFGGIDIDNLPAAFSSADEAKKWIPLSIASLESEQYKSRRMTVLSADETCVALQSVYADESGAEITLIQRMYAPGVSWGNSATADEKGVAQLELPGGLTAYLGTMGDGTPFAVIYTADGNITITGTGVSADELADIIKEIVLD